MSDAGAAIEVVSAYYNAFNTGDIFRFLGMLADDVVHDINQGGRETGRAAFAEFMKKMNYHYVEKVSELVVLANTDGSRASAEFVVEGTYRRSDEGLPAANDQTYRLAAGAFFELRGGKISRVTNYYNLQDWIKQVSQSDKTLT